MDEEEEFLQGERKGFRRLETNHINVAELNGSAASYQDVT